MKEIAQKMDRVDKEFQKKEMAIFQLDSQLQDAHAVIRQLSSKLNDECSRNRRSSIETEYYAEPSSSVSQKQIRDLQELKEFLHVENATLLETVKDAEFENERLKMLVEQKDGELSKSEEQCRHLVRLSEKRHQEILSVTFKLNSLERKAKEIILNQVLTVVVSYHPTICYPTGNISRTSLCDSRFDESCSHEHLIGMRVENNTKFNSNYTFHWFPNLSAKAQRE